MEYQSCVYFLFAINTIIVGILIITGLIGNTLTLITLIPDTKLNVISLLLVVLACCDSLFLITQIFLKFLRFICEYRSDEAICHYAHHIWPYVVKYVRPFGEAMVFSSIWIILLVTIYRTVAVLRPHHARRYATIKSVSIQCIILIAAAFILVAPRFFEYDIVIRNGTPDLNATKLNLEDSYGFVYNAVILNILVNIGPLVILCVLTCFLIREIYLTHKQNQRLREGVRSRRSYGRQLTILLLLVVIVFIICQIPRVVYLISRAILKDKYYFYYSCPRPWVYFLHFTDMLMVLNASINFFLYCIAGARFRKMLRGRCCPGLQLTPTSTQRGTTRTTRMHTPQITYSLGGDDSEDAV